jgi:hypothetical protein
MVLKIILFSALLVASFIISYQDFRSRLISVWSIVLYSICCISAVLLFENTYSLVSNSISTLIYFSFITLVLFVFYFIKEGRFINIIDSKIGLGDILIFIAIGLTLEIINLILFFTISFCISAIVGFFLARQNKTTPLAGILVWCHFCFLLIFHQFHLKPY